MDNNLENTLLRLIDTVEVLQRELFKISPSIDELMSKNKTLSEELESEVKRLVNVMDIREKSLVDFVKSLKPYILTIEQYKNFTPIIDNAIDEGIKKIGIAETSLIKSADLIPKETLVKTRHSIDYKSLSIVVILTMFICIALFSLGQIWLMNKQLDEAKSFEMRYRMIGLELPQVARSVDSLYNRDSEKFVAKVVKREEEQRLKWSIQQKQKEINELESQ